MREMNRERGSSLGTIRRPHSSSMCFRDSLDDGQTQARTIAFGGKEGLKDFLPFVAQSRAAVRDFDLDAVVAFTASDRKCPAAGHGIHRVQD